MEFEWDDVKRQSNLDKHDVDLLEAALIFDKWVLTEVDDRFEYGEVRFKSIGLVEGVFYVVIHAQRLGITRIISAWKGGQRDQRKYQEGYARRASSDEG